MSYSSWANSVEMRVVVEYDTATGRKQKEFTNALASRRFYLRQFKAGKNPKIVSAKRD